MKIAITGGRDYRITPKDIFWLSEQCAMGLKMGGFWDLVFVHGDARGVDRDIGWLLESKSFRVEKYPAEWEKYGKAAGHIRNAQMAEMCNLCLAFPGGTGTQNMIDTCKRLGKQVLFSPTRNEKNEVQSNCEAH